MRYILLFALTVCSACAVEDLLGVKLPLIPEAQKLVDKAEADAAKIQQKAKDDETKVRMALVAALFKIQEATTKKGSLDDALVIKEEVERQDKLIMAMEPKEVVKKAVAKEAALPLTDFLGTWHVDHDNPSITITEKGVEYKSEGQIMLSTMVLDKKTGTLHITWTSGWNNGAHVIFVLKTKDTATYIEANGDWTPIKEKSCTRVSQ